MGEYEGINVSKDTMLFVVNTVSRNGIKESTTKENILKMMPEIYEKADSKEIIKLLPYKVYMALEDLMEYPFQRIIKKSELGEDILSELIEKCRLEDEEEIKEFMELFMEWYNNSPLKNYLYNVIRH